MENAKNQLAVIEEMIATAKGNLSDGSIFYLIWGWFVLVAALSNYVFLNFTDYEYSWIAWVILMPLGAIITGVIGYRRGKKEKSVSYVDKFLQSLWLGFIISLVVLIFGMSRAGLEASYPFFMILYGLGTFVSGAALKFKPLQVGAVAAWVCAAIAFHVTFSDQLILIAAAILFSYIIPGHMLATKFKQSV